MSPKILTLIAGASLGLLMSAACTVTSVDDDGSGGTGTGAGTTTNSGGSGTGGDATGGTGTGGDATGGSGGGETCLGCNDWMFSANDTELVCGGEIVGENLECEAGSSCDLFVDVFLCACDAESACVDACSNPGADSADDDLCDFVLPPSSACVDCLENDGTCGSGALGACTADI